MSRMKESTVHVPECELDGYQVDGCSLCDRLRAAYARGREDAADEILKAGYQRSLNLIEAIAAARGGEQE